MGAVPVEARWPSRSQAALRISGDPRKTWAYRLPSSFCSCVSRSSGRSPACSGPFDAGSRRAPCQRLARERSTPSLSRVATDLQPNVADANTKRKHLRFMTCGSCRPRSLRFNLAAPSRSSEVSSSARSREHEYLTFRSQSSASPRLSGVTRFAMLSFGDRSPAWEVGRHSAAFWEALAVRIDSRTRDFFAFT